jgi:protein TonB
MSSLDDIVFENRNKAYGAYFLRTKYPQHIKYAMFIVTFSTTILLLGPFLYNKYLKEPTVVKKEKRVEVDLTPIDIPLLDPVAPPPPPPPPAPAVEQPKVKTVKYVPPKVVPDEEATDELPPTQEDMTTSAIGSENQDGEDDTTGAAIAPEGTGGEPGGTGTEDNTIYMPGAGVVAGYPGGQSAMVDYISKKMRPHVDKAAKLGEKGTVYLVFVIEKDGSVSNVTIMKGLAICTSCNEAAKEIVANMPKWEPAKSNGKPVRVRMQLPIKFDFED